MSLDAGNARALTGLAGAFQVATEVTFGPYPNEASREITAKFYDMLATTLINYLKANTQITIKTTDTGLQQYSYGESTFDTLGPNTAVTLSNVLV